MGETELNCGPDPVGRSTRDVIWSGWIRVSLHPDTRAEVLEAQKWYYERSPLTATAFAHEVDYNLVWSPFDGTPHQSYTRKASR